MHIINSHSEELRVKYGKLVTKAVKAQKRANQYEKDVSQAIAADVKQMEKDKNVAGLYDMSVLLQSLFINHFIFEAIHRIKRA